MNTRTAPRQEYLKVVFTPGVMPTKWFIRFDQRVPGYSIAQIMVDNPLHFVENDQADLAIARLDDYTLDTDIFHCVKLYQETPGIAVPKDHPVAVMDSISLEEIEAEGDPIIYQVGEDGAQDYSALRDALGVVGANVGVALAPRPLLKACNSSAVRDTELTGVSPTTIGLIWKKDRDNDVIQEFVGIARGRGKSSGRQPSVQKQQKANSKKAKQSKTPGK